jgi:hypothetical protein
MKDVLVDSNVILDIVTEDVNWFEWSALYSLERSRFSHRLASYCTTNFIW